jgi:hypothetical protein
MPSLLKKINQLKPTTYQFIKGPEANLNGVVAPVLKLPTRNMDQYTVDYSGFGVIAKKGIQSFSKRYRSSRKPLTS